MGPVGPNPRHVAAKRGGDGEVSFFAVVGGGDPRRFTTFRLSREKVSEEGNCTTLPTLPRLQGLFLAARIVVTEAQIAWRRPACEQGHEWRCVFRVARF